MRDWRNNEIPRYLGMTPLGSKIAGVHPAAARTKLGPLYAGVKVDKFKSAESEKPEVLLYM